MPISSSSFPPGSVTPPEIVQEIASTVIGGAPFARSLTPLPTTRGSVTFPTAAPDGFDWTAELDDIPEVDPHDAAHIRAVAKLAGILPFSNESLGDADLPVASLMKSAIQDAMSGKLDNGLLYGDGTPPAPKGLLDGTLHEQSGITLRDAAIFCWGDLVASGADAGSIVCFANPMDCAAELARETPNGAAHPDSQASDGFVIGPGIRLVPVAKLNTGDVLVADVSRTYLIQRSDFSAVLSKEAGFRNDSTLLRITGRFAVAAPAPDKTLRVATFESGLFS